jgi:hypothetical protein
LSRFRGTFHSFDPVGFAIFAIPQAASVGDGPLPAKLNEADFSGHSLRSGFLTSAARRGASVFKMRDVSRHKSMDVLQSYIRDAELFRDHAGAGLL